MTSNFYGNIFKKVGNLMSKYVLSCCSTADLTEEQLKSKDINYICFHFFLDDKCYDDDLGKSISFENFYKLMDEGVETKTSQVNVQEFIEYFSKFLKEGKDILHISLSSGISGTYNSALMAKEELEKQFPDRKIYIVDSLGASSGYGLLMDKAAELRDSGMSIEEVYNWLNAHKLDLHHWFFSTDLKFFIKGGRVSKTAGFVGKMLKICPLLDVNEEGKLIPREKIRTKERVKQEIVNKMEEHAKDGLNYAEKCYISNSACYEDAEEVKNLIESKFKNLKGKVIINSIGTTIGSHTGPGTVALFFWGDSRKK